jgi:putative ABC transport system substrate-binding protein
VTGRRAFIGGVAGGILASAFTVFAQRPAKAPRIGILGNTNAAAWEGFRQGLRELGYIDGRSIALEWRWAEGKAERFPDFAMEFVQMKADVIVTSGTQATQAVKLATSSIPIVMTTSVYPDKIGLVESLAHPGGNVTGMSNIAPELWGKRLQLLKETVPKVSRVAVMWNPTTSVEPLSFQDLMAAAAVAGLKIQSVEVRTTDEHVSAFESIIANRPDALLVYVNPVNSKNRQLIADFASRNRIPSICDEKGLVEAGLLLSYGPSYTDAFRQAATYVDKILKGARAGDLPIQQPTKFELVINLKTAKAIGLAIPPTVLARADTLIE